MNPTVKGVASVLTAILLAVTPVLSKETPRHREEVDVTVISLPVVVTDSRGEPVRGLDASAFQVIEDGKKRKVTNLTEYSGVSVILEEEAAAKLPAAGKAAEREELQLVVFVDQLNINPIRRNAVFERVKKYLAEDLDPGTPVMLVASDTSLRVAQPFTLDHDIVLEKLDELSRTNPRGLHTTQSRDQQYERVDQAVSEVVDCIRSGLCTPEIVNNMVRMAVSEIRSFASSIGWESVATVNGLRMLCHSLALTPGKKVVLFVSDGFPLEPGKDLMMSLRDKLDRAGRSSISADTSATGGFGNSTGTGISSRNMNDALQMVDRALLDSPAMDLPTVLEKTSSMAVANNVRIYSVQAQAITSGVAGADVDSRTAILDSNAQMGKDMRQRQDRAPLELMASATGGVTQFGPVSVQSLMEKIEQDARNYYSLGFESPNFGDGDYHKLKVKVKAKAGSYNIRHPDGYFARNETTRRADKILGAMLMGEAENPYEVALQFGEATVGEDARSLMPVEISIPVKHMDLIPEGPNHVGNLTLLIMSMDSTGKINTLQEHQVPVRIPSQHLEAAMGQSFPVRLNVVPVPGENSLAVGIWDDSTSIESFVFGKYMIEPDGEGE